MAWLGFVVVAAVAVVAAVCRRRRRRAHWLRTVASAALYPPRIVTLRGLARSIGQRLAAPLTGRVCIAYRVGLAGGRERGAATRFVVCVGSDLVLVEADAAEVVAEPRRDAARFETIVSDGDQVVVHGLLRRIDEAVMGPFTAATRPKFRLVATRRRPVLIVPPPERSVAFEATEDRLGRYGGRMSDKPLIVVPRSLQVSQMLEVAALSIEPRAQRVGVAVIAPRAMKPADLMVACHFWPRTLRAAGVARIAVVLGVESYVLARPVLMACKTRFCEDGITLEYFHEGHLESDQIRAWFENRRPRKRCSTDTLVKLAERYASRGDVRAAQHALRIAEAAASTEAERTGGDVPADRAAAARAAAVTVAA